MYRFKIIVNGKHETILEAKNEQDAIRRWHEEVNLTDPITKQQQSVVAVKVIAEERGV